MSAFPPPRACPIPSPLTAAAARTTIRAWRPLQRNSDGNLSINVPLYDDYESQSIPVPDPRDFPGPVDSLFASGRFSGAHVTNWIQKQRGSTQGESSRSARNFVSKITRWPYIQCRNGERFQRIPRGPGEGAGRAIGESCGTP